MADQDDRPVEPRHEIQHQYPANARFCPLCAGAMELRTVVPDRKRHKVCSRCGYIDFQSPKLVAGCLVIDAGRVLLLRRAIPPRLGYWTFPGGYVDFGEMPEPVALRETVEEVGMNVTLERLLGIYADPQKSDRGGRGLPRPTRPREPRTLRRGEGGALLAPAEIPWAEIAFRTTEAALRDWIKLAASPLCG